MGDVHKCIPSFNRLNSVVPPPPSLPWSARTVGASHESHPVVSVHSHHHCFHFTYCCTATVYHLPSSANLFCCLLCLQADELYLSCFSRSAYPWLRRTVNRRSSSLKYVHYAVTVTAMPIQETRAIANLHKLNNNVLEQPSSFYQYTDNIQLNFHSIAT